jgi:hypothetical protein
MKNQAAMDLELYKLLGIQPPQPNMSVMPTDQAGKLQNMPAPMDEEPIQPPPSEPIVQVKPTQPSQPPINAQTSVEDQSNYKSQTRGGFIPANNFQDKRMMISDELMESDGDQYRNLVKAQRDAVSAKLNERDEMSYLDLTPAMALVDQLTGSKFTQSYRAPKTADNDVSTLNTLGKQLADFENDKEKNRIALLNALKEKQQGIDPLALEEIKQRNRLQLASLKSGGKPSKAQETVDREFGKEYQKFVVSGGYGDARKGLDQLMEVSKNLKSNDNLTGPLVGKIPDFAQKVVNPEAIATREIVEEVVQRNLREILGAQFTEKEGDRLIARAYNPSLPEAENKKRLDRLVKQMQAAVDAKIKAARYYEQNGTLAGYNGLQINSVADIENLATGGDESTNRAPVKAQTNSKAALADRVKAALEKNKANR